MAEWDTTSLATAWNGFLETVDPFRADLYRYCRCLTGDVREAEDLIQDTLEQAFARLARSQTEVGSPRAYVLRIASNLWVSHVRRAIAQRAALRTSGSAEVASTDASAAEESTHVRAAAERLLGELSPQEQAALVLKEVFDLSLAEISETLGTTPGAVKAALHRGRGRLREVEAERRPTRNSVSTEANPLSSCSRIWTSQRSDRSCGSKRTKTAWPGFGSTPSAPMPCARSRQHSSALLHPWESTASAQSCCATWHSEVPPPAAEHRRQRQTEEARAQPSKIPRSAASSCDAPTSIGVQGT